jgi:hypothetical protein
MPVGWCDQDRLLKETFGRLVKAKNLTDGRQSSGERKRYWKSVRLVPEYLLEMEQAPID